MKGYRATVQQVDTLDHLFKSQSRVYHGKKTPEMFGKKTVVINTIER